MVRGAGEMADLVRGFDWAVTPLGPIEGWPKELLSIVNVSLSSPIPMLIYWGPELILIYNDAARPIASIKHPRALGASARDVWKEAWHIIGPEVEAVLSKAKSVRHEDILVPLEKDGTLQDMHWNYAYSPIYVGEEVGGVLLICSETTKSVLARKKLLQSEARANQILHSIGDAVIVTDGEMRVTRMNPVAETLTGWSLDEARGKPLQTIFHIVNETTRELVENPADKVKRLGGIVGLANHTVLIGKQGLETPIDDSGAPIFDEKGELAGIVLVFRDIRERRTVEQEKEAIARDLAQIQEATTDAVLAIDRDWRISYMNGPARRTVGPLAANAIGKVLWDVFPEASYDGSPFVENYRRAMQERERGSFEAFYPEPLNVWVSVRAIPTKDGIVVFFRDVTEEKRIAATLLQNEKLAAVGRLAASIAHEINNPLESVTNLLYLARRTEDTADLKEYLDMAERELRRMSVISTQTLRFHKQATNASEVTCNELFENVLAIYQGRIVNSRIRVEKRKRATKAVRCLEGEIRQVLSNLIGNAVDAIHPDGGQLFVRSRNATNWETGVKGIVLTVADTGNAMSEVAQAKAFDAFFTTKGIGGTGLGLWVSREIVDRHDGALRFKSSQSSQHRGTVFTLFLPFEAAV